MKRGNMFSALEIIDIAIQLEKNAEKIYREAQNQELAVDLIRLLGIAADEEKKHADWFAQLKNQLEMDHNQALFQELSSALVGDYVNNRPFSLQEIDFARVGKRKALIDIFIEFEKDTILFYQMIASFISDHAVLAKLNQIIAEEKTHIKKFEDLLPDTATE
jgi:rubrerythrin